MMETATGGDALTVAIISAWLIIISSAGLIWVAIKK